MISHRCLLALASLTIAAGTGQAHADFAGQTILGPLTAGSSVNGTLVGAPDINDGFTSGTHIFNIWDGGDRVYGLNWLGGDIDITLTPTGSGDPDLFLYTPDNLDDSGIYSTTNAIDHVSLADAAPGFYYIVVDTTFFSEGPFQLSVAAIPAPGALAMLGVAMLVGRRRRARCMSEQVHLTQCPRNSAWAFLLMDGRAGLLHQLR